MGSFNIKKKNWEQILEEEKNIHFLNIIAYTYSSQTLACTEFTSSMLILNTNCWVNNADFFN